MAYASRGSAFQFVQTNSEWVAPPDPKQSVYTETIELGANPGYPFTKANYGKSPFGSNVSAFEARQKLAAKFGFGGYVAYKNARNDEAGSLEAGQIKIEEEWDKSPELW